MDEKHGGSEPENEQNRIESGSSFDNIESLDINSNIAGIIAHDINNYLVAISGNISLAKTFLENESNAFNRLALAEQACEWINNYTDRLATFARAGKPVFKEESVGRLLKSSSLVILQDGKVKKEFDIDENLPTAEIDQRLIREVFINIVKNAANALNGNGTIKIRGENITLDGNSDLPLAEGQYIKITIQDDGPGFPAKKYDGMLKSTFSIKSGFGLPLSYYILKKHHGHLTLESEPGKGTTCTIYLPVKQNDAMK